MDNYEIISSIIAASNLLSITVIGILTYKNSTKLRDFQIQSSMEIKELQEKSLKLDMAQTELYIQELLVNARKIFLDMTLENLKLEINPNKNIQTELKNSLIKHTLQEILNSYEVACMKYLDDKIDKERFRKTYIKEITELFRTDGYNNLLNVTNSYQAIKKVNQEWNNLEN